MMFLIVFILLSGSKPVQHAYMACAEVMGFDEDGSGMIGATQTADSGGKVTIEGPAIDYHCTAWAEGYVPWIGVLPVTREHRRLVLNMVKK